jgi:hypothetical protein
MGACRGEKLYLRGTYHEDDTCDLDGSASREPVGNERGGERAKEGAGRHSCGDTALCGRVGIVKVGFVGISPKNSAHGRDVEAEEATACCNQ